MDDPTPATQARIDEIAAHALDEFRAKHERREQAIKASREIVRTSANAIRAVHRNELDEARELITTAGALVRETQQTLEGHADLYFTGYTQDAQKEYAEACAVLAFIARAELPLPADIGVETPSYLNGLAEAASELRRYILDSLRRDDDSRAEELMRYMDDVYNILVVMDFPDALTSGLRRTTDQLRGVLERTRGDLTMTMRQRRLERLLNEGAKDS
ncbi:MAG: haloacid dehalogenase [Chloroflexi bacterium]|nr:haloacid dehalogenase [Chloroflexota bacterium]